MGSAAGDADRAEELLLASSCPAAAIDMRKRKGHWERALELAEQLEPHAVGSLLLLRAQGLEAEGQAEAALAVYQQALTAPDLNAAAGSSTAAADCQGGLARCSIAAGEVERGMQLAVESDSPELLLQCAELLEGQQQAMQVREAGGARRQTWHSQFVLCWAVTSCEPLAPARCLLCEVSFGKLSQLPVLVSLPAFALPLQAGQLHARAEQYERAAELLLSFREFALLDGVMGHAGSPDLWLRYAQAKEGEWTFEAVILGVRGL
jgi:tetratricopeptide (TPR) repeat protein